MRRTKTLLIAATGSALSLLLGSGLLALLSDSVTSQGNEFASSTFAAPPPPPTSHNVKAALIANSLTSVCDSTTAVQDGPLPAAISTQTLDLSVGTLNQTGDFCIRNDGTQTGRLRVSLANIIDTEAGAACEATEIAAGDTTCAGAPAPDPGELGPALTWSFLRSNNPHSSTSCITSGPMPFNGTSTGVVDADLAPGDTCRVFFRATMPASTTDTQKLLAQTDRLQFDIVFTLEDL